MSTTRPPVADVLTAPVRGLRTAGPALGHAVLRDLRRVEGVLREPVTAVRRQQLISHLGFVLDQLARHHQHLDQALWPAAVRRRPDLADLAGEVGDAHAGLRHLEVRVAVTARAWAGQPMLRGELSAAVSELHPPVRQVIERDEKLQPVAVAALDDADIATIERLGRSGTPRLPTRVARRLFWLLDDLDPDRAADLLHGTPPAAMWILRNGFSGAYNRGTHLMWVGGGTGPAA